MWGFYNTNCAFVLCNLLLYSAFWFGDLPACVQIELLYPSELLHSIPSSGHNTFRLIHSPHEHLGRLFPGFYYYQKKRAW